MINRSFGAGDDEPAPADVAGAAAAVSAGAAAGIARIRAFLCADGALSAAEKALAMAFAHAALQQDVLLRRELDRAGKLGLPADAAAGAAALLLLTRGDAAFHAFTAAAAERFDLHPGGGTATDADVSGSLAYFREHFGGEVPERQRLFAELAPEAFTGYRLMHEAALAGDLLPTRTAELLLCSALAAEYAFALLDVHVAGARRAGASEHQIAEAILCAVPAAGVTAWAGGAGAILRTRAG